MKDSIHSHFLSSDSSVQSLTMDPNPNLSRWNIYGSSFNISFPVSDTVTKLALFSSIKSQPFIDSFCQPAFDGTWSSLSNELGAFTPCFIDIVILGTAHLAMLILALARFWVLQITPPREKLTKTFYNWQVVASVLALACGIIPLMQLSARVSFADLSGDSDSIPPFEVVSLVISFLGWAALFLALLRELRSSTARGAWYVRFAIIYTLVGQLAKLRFVIQLQDTFDSFFVWLFFSYTAAHVLLGIYAVSFFPVREPARGRHRHRDHRNREEAQVPEETQIDENVEVSEVPTTDYVALPSAPPGEEVFPELHCRGITGFFSRITFSWMGPLLKVGHSRPLQDPDVWQLDPSDSAAVVSERFSSVWQNERQKSRPLLVRALHTTFGARFWYAGIYKGFDNLAQFVGPVMLKSLLSAMQSDEPGWHGYVYATAIFVGIVGGVLFDAQFFTNVQRVGFQIRQALVAAVFRKSLRLSYVGRQGFSSGRIVNMMTNDVETLQLVMQQLHNLWSAPFRIVLCMVLLYQELGVAALVGLVVLLFLIPIQAFMMNQQRKLVKQSLIKADKRIGLMNEILAAMDVVKCYAWEDSFKEKVLGVRTEELGRLRLAQYISAVNFFIVNSVPVIVTVVGFGVFSLLGGELTPAKAFTSISLFSILRMPLYMLPQLITQVVNSNVSLSRLQDMLLAEERTLEGNPPMEEGKPAVEVRNSSFTWGPKTEKDTLQDISLTVQPGKLVAIVGATGQGKSSLLSALIGEMPPLEGHSPPIIRGRVAYVSQISWIFNATVRDNILFGLPYDQQSYDRAVRVSGLVRDLELLPGGDLTEIGERGINVSGGQKQRISIARAVYSDAEVFIFDDPLSALDAHVAKQVFESCVHDALKGKTRIMVTNQLHFLPQVDQIVLLEDGRIVEQGTYNELISHGKYFQELMEQAGSMEDGTVTENGDGNAKTGNPLTKQLSKKPSKGTRGREGEGKGREKPEKAGTQLVMKEERETGVVSLSVLARYMNAMGGPWALILLLGLFSMVEIPRVGSSLWVGFWSGSEATKKATHPVKYYITIYALICGSQVFFVLCRQFWMALSTLRAAQRLHAAMLRAVLEAPMSFFQANPVGRLINRFSKDTSDVDKNLNQQGTLFLQYFFQLISTFGLIGALNTFALWAIVPLLLAFYFVYSYFQDTAREIKRLDAITRSPIYAQFGEALNGQATIRTYHAQDRMGAMNGVAMDKNTRYAVASMAANRWLAVRLEFLGGLMVWATAIFAVLDVQKAVDQAAAASTMGIILSYSLTITMIMTNVLRLASLTENSLNSVERVGNYADIESEGPAIIENRRPPPGWPNEGEVSFENVVMRYRKDLPPVLKGLTAEVKGGEKVGVVGRTGAGKSSLFNSLFRISEIESGKISIDGFDLSQFGLADVRRALMIIPQTPVLFTGTIRFNLDPFEEHPDAEIWEALGRAHLRDLVSRMPLGLQTQVVEGGDNFSVGQRQLLSLARALLRRSKILVLDEATAAVDVGTDALIQKTIREEFKDCTMLIIAHRLNTIIDSDRILVMDNGQVVEYDTPRNLLSNDRSVFSGMVQSTGTANAKYLVRIAMGEVDVKESLGVTAEAEIERLAHEAATNRWSSATQWALANSLTASAQVLEVGVRRGAARNILDEVRESVVTLQAVLAGERASELEEALRNAEANERAWWSALLRVVQGHAVMGRQLQNQLGNEEDDSRAGLPWSRQLVAQEEGRGADD